LRRPQRTSLHSQGGSLPTSLPAKMGRPAPLAQSAEHIHGKDGVGGSIPPGGSIRETAGQTRCTARPFTLPGRRWPAGTSHLSADCQQVTPRARLTALRGVRFGWLERMASPTLLDSPPVTTKQGRPIVLSLITTG